LQEPQIERLGKPQRAHQTGCSDSGRHQPGHGKSRRGGTFREDLFHRLKVFVVELPALRHRGAEDLDALLVWMVDGFRIQLGKTRLSVDPETIALVKSLSMAREY
jgi:DNA-binding NtrC family response regulator